jgi:ketosteroid isomerase-like protein
MTARQFLLTLVFALGLTSPAQADAAGKDRAAVVAAVDRFLGAINSNDAATLEALYMPQAVLFVQRPGPDGKPVMRVRTGAEDVAKARGETRKFHEFYWNPRISVHGGIATFEAPYAFDIDGKRSHCGIDVFSLVLVDGAWRIASAMYTVEPDGCPKP